MSIVAILSEVDLFRSLPMEGLTRLSKYGTRKVFPPASQLLRQGDASAYMYVLVSGRVRIEREDAQGQGPILLAELGPGEVVGEMGLLDQAPRSATVTALEETEVVELSAAALSVVVLQHAESAIALLRVFSRRLRNADELAEQMLSRARSDRAT